MRNPTAEFRRQLQLLEKRCEALLANTHALHERSFTILMKAALASGDGATRLEGTDWGPHESQIAIRHRAQIPTVSATKIL
jgi:hypothetical protein